jgi:hypothetical protein
MLSNSDNMLNGEYMPSDNIPLLSELEKKVILKLAENGPMCGYDFHLGGKRKRASRQAMMSSGSWDNIRQTLGPHGENLIDNIRPKGEVSHDERGRRKDLVWLTPEGVIFMLSNTDVDTSILLKNVRKVYPGNAALSLAVEIAQMAGKDITRTSYLFKTCQYDKLDPSALFSMISKNRDKKERTKLARRLIQLLTKYPQYRKHFKEGMKDMRNTLNSVIDMFEETHEPIEE